MTTGADETSGARSRVPGYVAASLAMAAMAVIGFFYLTSALVVPPWAVIVLVVIWAVLVGVGVFWFRRHPLRVLVLPVAAVLIWVAVLTLGERLLGWTA